ncbi:unnamed protein product [Prorocentrum cordatum]|uniref:Photosystem I reaction center subunit IX n=1 Tax=Prorocentrum cordatum TaxID=2364126 RepID=A0ABN9Q024_9DINO|nr:unnamed protein product [Polarella glacialis]
MPSTARRPAALPALLLALGAAALLSSPGAFLPAPAPARPAGVDAAALGAASGLLVATDAAHANGSQLFGARYTGLLFEEIIPYALVSSFTILWGIVLGFVLLRLQEAFPE